MNRTIEAEAYGFSIGSHDDAEQATHVGLHVIEADGTRTTLALPEQDAQVVGRMLCAHSDYLAQRPPRDW